MKNELKPVIFPEFFRKQVAFIIEADFQTIVFNNKPDHGRGFFAINADCCHLLSTIPQRVIDKVVTDFLQQGIGKGFDAGTLVAFAQKWSRGSRITGSHKIGKPGQHLNNIMMRDECY